LPDQNDCIASAFGDRISFDKTPFTRQKYRAAEIRLQNSRVDSYSVISIPGTTRLYSGNAP
jgi:hypothetical protein